IVSAPQPREVGAILLDLSMTDTKNQSSAFAEMLRESVSQVSNMVRNPHREDNFYVLLAPDVPAVLLEMGFMSNPEDESNLKSRTYRQRLMSAVAQAIDDYFGARRQRYAGNWPVTLRNHPQAPYIRPELLDIDRLAGPRAGTVKTSPDEKRMPWGLRWALRIGAGLAAVGAVAGVAVLAVVAVYVI